MVYYGCPGVQLLIFMLPQTEKRIQTDAFWNTSCYVDLFLQTSFPINNRSKHKNTWKFMWVFVRIPSKHPQMHSHTLYLMSDVGGKGLGREYEGVGFTGPLLWSEQPFPPNCWFLAIGRALGLLLSPVSVACEPSLLRTFVSNYHIWLLIIRLIWRFHSY